MDEGHLQRFYNLREQYSEHFDEERAKEIAKWLKEYQEEVYLDKLLEEGLSHEEAWKIAINTTSSGVSIEELTATQKGYSGLLREWTRISVTSWSSLTLTWSRACWTPPSTTRPGAIQRVFISMPWHSAYCLEKLCKSRGYRSMKKP